MASGRVDGETVRLHNPRDLVGRQLLTPLVARKEKNFELLGSKLLVPAPELTVCAGGRASARRNVDEQSRLCRKGCQAEIGPADLLYAQSVQDSHCSGSGQWLARLGIRRRHGNVRERSGADKCCGATSKDFHGQC